MPMRVFGGGDVGAEVQYIWQSGAYIGRLGLTEGGIVGGCSHCRTLNQVSGARILNLSLGAGKAEGGIERPPMLSAERCCQDVGGHESMPMVSRECARLC